MNGKEETAGVHSMTLVNIRKAQSGVVGEAAAPELIG
jgi:hypothetical protein